MIIQEILRNCDLSPLDAELILSFTIKRPREYLFAYPEKELSPAQIAKFNRLADRRLKDEPIAYLTGKKEFYNLEFEVNKNVLIPRPETELLVEKVLNLALKVQPFSSLPSRREGFPKVEPLAIIDIGTGSGNIIISIVKNTPAKVRNKINFYATDISKKALNTAKKNAKRHEVAKYTQFIKSDLLEFVRKKKIEGNIIIIANLPYVSHKSYRKNSKNLKYEPKQALFSRRGGLEHYIRLIGEIRKMTQITNCKLLITLLFEISPEQKNGLTRIVKRELPAAKIKFFKDFARKTRAAEIVIGN